MSRRKQLFETNSTKKIDKSDTPIILSPENVTVNKTKKLTPAKTKTPKRINKPVVKVVESDDHISCDSNVQFITSKSKKSDRLALSPSPSTSDKFNNEFSNDQTYQSPKASASVEKTPNRLSDITPKNSGHCSSSNLFAGHSSITIEKLPDLSHALVYWPNEGSYSVVSRYAIITKPTEKVKVNEEYDIFFGNKSYKGLVRCLGHKDFCHDILKDITQSPNFKSQKKASPLKENAKKISSTCDGKKGSSDDARKKNSELENENIRLKQKLVDLTEACNQIKTENIELHEEVKSLNEIIQQHKDTFNKEEVERLLKMCQIFQNIYLGKSNGMVLVSLSDKFINILVDEQTKTEIFDELEQCKEGQGPCYFRKVLNILIKDSAIFQNNTAKQIKELHTNHVNAVYQLIKERDSSFSTKIMNGVLNTMVQDSKKTPTQKLKQNEKLTQNSTTLTSNSNEINTNEIEDEN